MGKKPVPKAKAKTKTEAELKAEEEAEKEAAAKAEERRKWTLRKNEGKWAQAKVDELVDQRDKAAAADAWLAEPHNWQMGELKKVKERLELKLLAEIPAELKEKVTAYVSQCADGADGKEAGFKDDREMYAGLPALPDTGPYARAAQSPEAEKAMEELGAWSDTSAKGMSKFVEVMLAFGQSAGVQEAGLTRIGYLLSEAKEVADARDAPLEGATAAILMPGIEAGMTGFIRDPEVQRRGCAALRVLALNPDKVQGQVLAMCDKGASKLLFECLKEQLKVTDVVLAATAAVWAMAKAAGKNSPELGDMRAAGIVEILKKVMVHHAWDQTLCGKVRVVLPFLVEE